MRHLPLIAILLWLSHLPASHAQVGINQATPDASAILDIVSTSKGFLIPRMTTAQRNAINSGTIAQGNMIYNTDSEAFEFYNGANWISVGNEGTNNAYVGENSGDAISTGQDNVFMGFNSGSANNTGSSNVFLGSGAGDVNTDGSDNVIIGQDAGGLATSPEVSAIIGASAASALTTGTGNVAIGYDAMNAVTTNGDNVVIGTLAGQDLTAGSSVLIGSSAGAQITSGASNVAIGYAAGEENQTGDYNVVIGLEAGEGSTGASNYNRNTLIGHRAGEDMITNGADNTFVGYQAGLNNTDGINNVVMGSEAASTMTSDDNNVYIGYKAGNAATGSSDNVYIGSKAGLVAAGANSNVVIGYAAYEGLGATAPSGSGNVVIGKNAGPYLTDGSNNVFMSMYSGYFNRSGDNHTVIGYNALTQNNSAGGCTAIGYESQINTTGANNTTIGEKAGDNITSGATNIVIGTDINAVSATASNQLNIGNSIYGDMANDRIGISNTAPFCPLDVAGVLGSTVARFGDVNGVYIGRDWPGFSFNTYYDGTNNVYGHGSSSEYAASIYMNPATGEIQHAISAAAGNAGATATLTTNMNIEPSGETGFGTADPTSRLHAVGLTSAPAATFDRITSTGTIVSLHYNGAEQGTISTSDGTTISYNAFTGAHYALADSDIPYGTLVKSTGNNGIFHNQTKGEIVYGITTSHIENDPTVLGVIDGQLDGSKPLNYDNPSSVSAVGNGKMWAVQTERNINVGDYLVSSAVPGHAQLDQPTYDRSYIIGRAVEAVNWSLIQPDSSGRKSAQISVYFENFIIDRSEEHELQNAFDALTKRIETLKNAVLDQANR